MDASFQLLNKLNDFILMMARCFNCIRIILLVTVSFFFVPEVRGGNGSLAKMRAKCSKALERRDFENAKVAASEYYEATKSDSLGNDHGYANFYLGAALMFTGDGNRGASHLNKALKIGESVSNDSLTGLALNSLGIYEANVKSNYYVAQHYLLRSLDCPGMKATAYRNLAQIARLQRDTTGIHYARKCYEEGILQKDNFYIYNGLITIAEFEILQENYDEATRTLDRAAAIGAKGYKGDTTRMQFLKALVLSNTGQSQKSNSILFALHDSIEKKSPVDLAELEMVIGKNYVAEGNLLLSNQWLQKAVESGEKYSSRDYIGQIYRLLSDNFHRLGDDVKALHYMTLAWEVESENAKSERSRMSKERALTIDLINKEKEQIIADQKLRAHKIFSFLLLGLLIAASAIIILIIRNLRKRNRLYRHIVSNNLKLIEEKEQAQKRITELESNQKTEELPKQNKAQQSKTKELFDSLERMMKEEKVYRNPLLTREEVIKTLHTNSTYLTQCIRENAGMNYSQYVNSFRIKEALLLLSDIGKLSIPIKDIAEEAGFNSSTTFYKTFQDEVGISPAAYRKSLQKLQ